jgi:predicted RNA-binding protein YlqC (UPF0109 family)
MRLVGCPTDTRHVWASGGKRIRAGIVVQPRWDIIVDSTVLLRRQRRKDGTADEIRALLESLVKQLIDEEEVCRIKFVQSGNVLLMEITPESVRAAGQLIGKQGRTIDALRVLATAICAKFGWRLQLEIIA